MTNHVLDDAPLSAFHKKLALYSSGGPFLDGYILSIVGVTTTAGSGCWPAPHCPPPSSCCCG